MPVFPVIHRQRPFPPDFVPLHISKKINAMQIPAYPPGIKNIVFDLGGVLLDLDFDRPLMQFRDLGMTDDRWLFSYFEADSPIHRLETGELEPARFLDMLLPHFPDGTQHDDLRHAWNSILSSFSPDHVTLLEELRRHYRVFLLSNINEFHIQRFEEMFLEVSGNRPVQEFFDDIFYSCRVGDRKPSSQIFSRLLEKNDLAAHETIFIDDLAPNVKAAESIGIHGYHLHPQENRTLQTLFRPQP